METGDFLDSFIKRGGRTVGGTVHGWKHETFRGLAKLTSYLVFGCDFDEKGLCKARRYPGGESDEKAQMCCCRGCRSCFGFLYQLPESYDVIQFYASCFDDKTGFWRKDTGCILPRSHRSSTCLTYNCDRNECRPTAHRVLLDCLRGKKDSVIIDGKELSEYFVVAALGKWLKKKPTYKTAKEIL